MAAVRNFFSPNLDSGRRYTIAGSNTKFRAISAYYIRNSVCKSTITNMATV